MHNLLKELSNGKFDNELRDVYKSGKTVLNNKDFISIENIIDSMEERSVAIDTKTKARLHK